MKRAASPEPSRPRPLNEYSGYRLTGSAIATVDALDDFHERFIATRTPVKINVAPPISIADFRLEKLVDTLKYEGELQVEKKHAHGFGLGQKRVTMTLDEVVALIKGGSDEYYLTTQYGGDDSESPEDDYAHDLSLDESDSLEEAVVAMSTPFPTPLATADASSATEDAAQDSSDFEIDSHDDYLDNESDLMPDLERVAGLLQPPLTNLCKTDFPLAPPPFQKLVPQQINLWMGALQLSPTPDLTHPELETLGRYVPLGTSLGLHHDHADNLYLLVEGRKRFTLFCPADAEKLYTHGRIRTVYSNGVIDYVPDSCAPHWREMRADGKLDLKSGVKRATKEVEPAVERSLPEPPSFSRVPPVFAHLDEVGAAERAELAVLAERAFPGFLALPRVEVWLEAGDMLYVPAGWFHEVLSLSGQGGAHVALNWWFAPPVRGGNPYVDGYWREDFEATKAAIGAFRLHVP